MPEGRHSWPVLIGVVALALAACAATLMASAALARSFSIALYAAATLAAVLDLLDLCVRLYFCRLNGSRADTAHQATASVALETLAPDARRKRSHLLPYAIVASIHNAEDSLDDFMEAMAPHRERIWLIDDASTDLTLARLRQAGWRCDRVISNSKKPGAIKALVETLPAQIETIVVIDPDVVFHGAANGAVDLEAILFDFQRSGMAAACPRIAVREEGFLTRFQALEYCMSFSLGRRSLGQHCINSGISIYRRADLRMLLAKHTLSVYAEDFENSLILMGAFRPLYYDGRLVVETEGKRDWKDWFSQRVGWHYGLLRVYVQYFGLIRRIARGGIVPRYQLLVYTGIFCIALQPAKVFGLVLILFGAAKGVDSLAGFDLVPDSPLAEPAYFLGAYAKYTVFAFAALFLAVPRRERAASAPVVPLYFLYATAHVVPATVGYLNWIAVRVGLRRLFADHYQEHVTLPRAAREA